MTQAFNPFSNPITAGIVNAPAQPGPAAQRQPPAQRDLNTAGDDGFTTPFLRHVDCELDVRIDGYAGAKTPMLGRACHITFQVLASNTPDVPVGQTYRVAYKYDFERSEQAEKDPYGSDLDMLSSFVHALFGQPKNAGFDAKASERTLHMHDWKAQPGFVHLSGTLGKPKVVKGSNDMRRYRTDRWAPTKR